MALIRGGGMDMEDNRIINEYDRYLSPLDVWAIAFGCIIGWGAFMMPGSTFLPVAGPMGTVISIAPARAASTPTPRRPLAGTTRSCAPGS